MDDLVQMELQLELKALREEVDKLQKENKELRDTLVANDLGDEIGVVKPISPEEEICILGIEQILELVRNKTFDKNDVANYDILHKNLRMIRGQATDTKKQKKTSKAELLRIVESNK